LWRAWEAAEKKRGYSQLRPAAEAPKQKEEDKEEGKKGAHVRDGDEDEGKREKSRMEFFVFSAPQFLSTQIVEPRTSCA
jgi:hypothetical protein